MWPNSETESPGTDLCEHVAGGRLQGPDWSQMLFQELLPVQHFSELFSGRASECHREFSCKPMWVSPAGKLLQSSKGGLHSHVLTAEMKGKTAPRVIELYFKYRKGGSPSGILDYLLGGREHTFDKF